MPAKPAQNKRRKYRKPTPERLAAIALHYLSRYAASEASLRRVLENRLRRAAMSDEAFAADTEGRAALMQAIDKIVETHIRTGVLNDAAFAEMKVVSLRRAGRSARVITQKLNQKGIKADLIAGALTPEDDDTDPREVELTAARAMAKRRGLGPYRKPTVVALDAEARHDVSNDAFDEPYDPDCRAAQQAAAQAKAKRAAKEIATLARAGFSFDVAKEVLETDFEAE